MIKIVFYSKQQRTVFGIVVLYRRENGEIGFLNFDYVSQIKNHNSYFVTKAIEKMMSFPLFQSFEFKKIDFWYVVKFLSLLLIQLL